MNAGRSNPWWVVTLLTLCYVLSLVDRLIVGLLVEPLKSSLLLSDLQIALLQGPAFAFLYAVMGVPLGRAADLGNRKNLIAGAIALWSLCTLGCGLAGSFFAFFIARIGVGVGEAALSPAAYSIFADRFERNQLGRAISVFTVGGIAGAGLSLLLGGMLYGYFSRIGTITMPLLGMLVPWQMTFIALAAPGLLVALIVYATVHEPARLGDSTEKPSLREVLSHIGAAAGFYIPTFIVHAIIAGSLYGFYGWAPTYMVRQFSLGPAQVGPSFGLVVIAAGVLGPPVAGWLADACQRRFGVVAPLRVMGAFFIALLVAALVSFRGETFAAALMGCAVVAFVGSAMLGLPPIALQLAAPNRMRGQIAGISLMISNLVGLGAGPVIVAALSTYVFPAHGLGFVLALVIATGAVVGAALCFAARRATPGTTW